MALPLLEEQFNDIDFQFCRFRQRDFIGGRRIRQRLANAQARTIADGDNLRDCSVPIQNGNGLSALHGAEKFAQLGFQFRYAHLFHDHI